MSESVKVQPHHLERGAYLYIRQSSMRQVIENVESTKRQYALRSRAIALGWRDDRIIVIDSDQGESGASASWREGFQRLVSDVGMGRAGIVMGLEVSRLARNNADWHRLLEICALADTLILDEDGVYDPASFNDRLLLGLKGTMSEAELHVIKARLRGGILNKVRRGEYRCALPTGCARNARVVAEMRQHRRRQSARLIEAAQNLDADVEIGRAFLHRLHLRLEGEVAQLHVVDRVADDDQPLGMATVLVRPAIPGAHRVDLGDIILQQISAQPAYAFGWRVVGRYAGAVGDRIADRIFGRRAGKPLRKIV